jgi:hypothetical protein
MPFPNEDNYFQELSPANHRRQAGRTWRCWKMPRASATPYDKKGWTYHSQKKKASKFDPDPIVDHWPPNVQTRGMADKRGREAPLLASAAQLSVNVWQAVACLPCLQTTILCFFPQKSSNNPGTCMDPDPEHTLPTWEHHPPVFDNVEEPTHSLQVCLPIFLSSLAETRSEKAPGFPTHARARRGTVHLRPFEITVLPFSPQIVDSQMNCLFQWIDSKTHLRHVVLF